MIERIIVSLTTWEKRLDNLPEVLDSIFSQTVIPDLVVLNISNALLLPVEVEKYLVQHNVEVNRVKDTKVFKKLIPTLKKYPQDCVISIDDDWIYPRGMIQEFVSLHKQFPNNPISGKKELCGGIPVHCGCASLTKASFYSNIDLVDEEVMANCKSDDIVYSYFAAQSGHPYIWTVNNYYTNMIAYNSNDAYTTQDLSERNSDIRTLEYLVNRFGNLKTIYECFNIDPCLSCIFDMHHSQETSLAFVRGEMSIKDTWSYKLGHAVLCPIYKVSTALCRIFKNNKK